MFREYSMGKETKTSYNQINAHNNFFVKPRNIPIQSSKAILNISVSFFMPLFKFSEIFFTEL